MKYLIMILFLFSCSKSNAPKLIENEPDNVSEAREEFKKLEIDQKTKIPKIILKEINQMKFESPGIKQIQIDEVKRSMFFLNTKTKEEYKKNEKKFYSYKACEFIDYFNSFENKEDEIKAFFEYSKKNKELRSESEEYYKLFEIQLYLDGTLNEIDYTKPDYGTFSEFEKYCVR